MPPLPTDIAIVVAGLASVLSSWLKGDGLSDRANGLIALVALVIAAGASIFLTTGFSSNLKDDLLLLIAMCFTLFNTFVEYRDLLSYLKNSPSALAPNPAELAVKPTVKSWPSDGE
jgi:hypothetical protein